VNINWSKVLSLAVTLGYIIALLFYGHERAPAVVYAFIGLLFPLLFIWFPEPIGNYTGFFGLQNYIDEKTSSIVISLTGWFFLTMFPLLIFLCMKYG